MTTTIKTIEDLSFNAWPSYQIQLYDGWAIRFSYFYTHRTNSVEQLGKGALPIDEKIDFCEDVYRSYGTPSIFKITPLLNADFEKKLIDRGYIIEHATKVMTMKLASFHYMNNMDISAPVNITNFIPPKWIDTLFTLNGTTNTQQKRIVPSMYKAIPKEILCASILGEDGIIATGLGIIDRNFIGIYAIHAHPSHRHHGYARSICNELLRCGKERGLTEAYLQVVSGNDIAEALYASLGFQYYYSYHFRVKH